MIRKEWWLAEITVLLGVLCLSGCGTKQSKEFDEIREGIMEEAGNIEDTFNMLQEEVNNL